MCGKSAITHSHVLLPHQYLGGVLQHVYLYLPEPGLNRGCRVKHHCSVVSAAEVMHSCRQISVFLQTIKYPLHLQLVTSAFFVPETVVLARPFACIYPLDTFFALCTSLFSHYFLITQPMAGSLKRHNRPL